MSFELQEIRNDLNALDEKQFYKKYIIRSDNWYFENILGVTPDQIINAVDDFKGIVSENLGISFHCVMMVGSGKVGYSLSPSEDKFLKPFNDDEKVRKLSDIDIAIISSELFHKYWSLFRKSYKHIYKQTYIHVYNEIYRGYINERNLLEVEGCRKTWVEGSANANKLLYNEMSFKHKIAYRIYRSWEDFEEYNIQNIAYIKRGM